MRAGGFREALAIAAATILCSGGLPDPAGVQAQNGKPPKQPLPAKPSLLVAPFDAAAAKKKQAEWAAHLGKESSRKNAAGMELVLIPAGEYRRGSSDADVAAALRAHPNSLLTPEFFKNEQPQHSVRISGPFFMGATEVTQAEFAAVTGRKPSYFSPQGEGKSRLGQVTNTDRFPVERITWFDAVEFCNLLSPRDGLTPHYSLTSVERSEDQSIKSARVKVAGGNGYRLPTEAEWEYACRAGTITLFHFGSANDGTKANVDGNHPFGTTTKGKSLGRTTQVGSFPANAFGLHDMQGNVCEWCGDWYDEAAYSRFGNQTAIDPAGPDTEQTSRVLRGGVWNGTAWGSRSVGRGANSPDYRGMVGLRVVVSTRTP